MRILPATPSTGLELVPACPCRPPCLEYGEQGAARAGRTAPEGSSDVRSSNRWRSASAGRRKAIWHADGVQLSPVLMGSISWPSWGACGWRAERRCARYPAKSVYFQRRRLTQRVTACSRLLVQSWRTRAGKRFQTEPGRPPDLHSAALASPISSSYAAFWPVVAGVTGITVPGVMKTIRPRSAPVMSR